MEHAIYVTKVEGGIGVEGVEVLEPYPWTSVMRRSPGERIPGAVDAQHLSVGELLRQVAARVARTAAEVENAARVQVAPQLLSEIRNSAAEKEPPILARETEPLVEELLVLGSEIEERLRQDVCSRPGSRGLKYTRGAAAELPIRGAEKGRDTMRARWPAPTFSPS